MVRHHVRPQAALHRSDPEPTTTVAISPSIYNSRQREVGDALLRRDHRNGGVRRETEDRPLLLRHVPVVLHTSEAALLVAAEDDAHAPLELQTALHERLRAEQRRIGRPLVVR